MQTQGGTSRQINRWTGRTRGGYLGNWIFVNLLRVGGPWLGYFLLVPVTFYYLLFASQAVKASQTYLRRLGYKLESGFERWWLAYKHFYSFGQTLLDRIAIIAGNASRYAFVFEGQHHIETALAEGKGVLIISAHFGNWQAAAHLLGTLNVPVHIVAYDNEVAPINQLFAEALKKRLFSVISLDNDSASLEIITALRRGEIVAMHADRSIGDKHSVRLNFLGFPANFPSGPYTVAALSGAPLIHTFAVRRQVCSYHLYAYPPQHLAFGSRQDRPKQLEQWVSSFVERLEAHLKSYPLQWYNFYEFWEGPLSPSSLRKGHLGKE